MIPFVNQLVRIGRNLFGRPFSVNSKVFTVTSPEVYSKIDNTNAIEKGFNNNTAVYTVVMKDAKKFGTIPRFVYDSKLKEEKAARVTKNGNIVTPKRKFVKAEGVGKVQELINLLNRPNRYQSQDEFLTLVRAFYKITGEGIVWLNRGDIESYRLPDGSFDDMAIDKLPVLEMHILPPNLMTIIPDPADLWGGLGWILEIPERVVVRWNDVILWKTTNLNFDPVTREHMRGMPPLKPGAKTLEENNAVSKSAMRQAQNDGAKYVLFNETMNSMSPTQQGDLKRVIDSKINNNDIAGAVATLQGKWGGLDLGKSSHDMELMEAKKLSWRELALLFDVPPEFVDTETKYDNMGNARGMWVSDSIIPACKQFDGLLNLKLLRSFGLEGTVFIGTDYSELPEIQQLMMDSAKIMQEIWSISPNDVREYLGFEPYDDERFDVPWVPSGGRLPLTDMQNPEDEIERELEINRIKYSANGKS